MSVLGWKCASPKLWDNHPAPRLSQRRCSSSCPLSRLLLTHNEATCQSRLLYQTFCSGNAGPITRIPPLQAASPANRRRTQWCRGASASESGELPDPPDPSTQWQQQFLTTATSLYPLYIVLGSTLAVVRPSSFAWFVERSPNSYSAALGCIMLAMGLTMGLRDLVSVIVDRPFAMFFGCAAQYAIMPLAGAAIARMFGLSPELSAGLVLLACCPGGTASNVVTLIAQGDVPLSILMTICTTFAAVIATPILTQLFAGAYIPVDVIGLATSTLQVVLVPVLLGAWLQSTWPKLVGYVKSVAPLVAVLASSLLSSSVFSANLSKLGSLTSTTGPGVAASLISIAGAVTLLHAVGFLLGYAVSIVGGLGEAQQRAISIEVGMQNSSLGVVLATAHFSSPLASVPAAISGIIMNVMASGLAVGWRQFEIKDV